MDSLHGMDVEVDRPVIPSSITLLEDKVDDYTAYPIQVRFAATFTNLNGVQINYR